MNKKQEEQEEEACSITSPCIYERLEANYNSNICITKTEESEPRDYTPKAYLVHVDVSSVGEHTDVVSKKRLFFSEVTAAAYMAKCKGEHDTVQWIIEEVLFGF